MYFVDPSIVENPENFIFDSIENSNVSKKTTVSFLHSFYLNYVSVKKIGIWGLNILLINII